MRPSVASVAVPDMTTDQLRDFLLQCDWAGPQFVKLAAFHRLDGSGLLHLTKRDLRDTYGVTELGEVKKYLREIQSLDPTQRRLDDDPATSAASSDFTFSPAPPKGLASPGRTERLTTPTFNRFGVLGFTQSLDDALSTSDTATPRRSAPLLSGSSALSSPLVGSDHRSPRKLTRSFATNEPPTVVTLEEYQAYRLTSPVKASGPPSPEAGSSKRGGKHRKKKAKAVPQEKKEEDRWAATKALEEAKKREEEFKANLAGKLTKAFQRLDRDNRGYIKLVQLDQLLRDIFPTFSPKMVQEYKGTVLAHCDEASGKVLLVDFIESVSSKLAGVEAAFRMVDKDGTGTIDYLELEDLLRRVFPTYGKKELKKYHNSIIAECDKSGEGKIDLDEFVMSQYANLLSGPAELEIRKAKREAKLESLFQTVDTDGSGCISYDELKELIRQVFPDYGPREQQNFFDVVVDECDKDRSGLLEFDEFKTSDYANLMLAQFEDEDDIPRAMRAQRDTQLDRGEWKSRTPDPADGASGLRITNLGSTETEQEEHGFLTAEAAAQRRRQREEEERRRKEQEASEARKRSRATIARAQEELKAEKLELARDVMRQQARVQKIGYVPGILEKERRFAYITTLFQKWDESSDISRDGSGFIEYSELRSVLQRFYNWSDAEADANADAVIKKMDVDMSGSLDFQEFLCFMDGLTRAVSPQQFDNLMKFLYAAIADFSKDQEHDRRVRLLTELFQEWDYDKSGVVDQKELYRVLTRFNDMERDGGEERFVELMLTGADENNDGQLDQREFVTYFDGLTHRLTPDDFDFMIYRMHRCLEEVLVLLESNFASIRYKQVLLNALEGYEIDELLKNSTPFSPLICYGTACDPARAIEQYAKGVKMQVKAFLVTHDKGERTALAGMQRWGFRLGYWVLFVLGKDYDCDGFLRRIGLALQTQQNTAMNPRFRLWVHAPFPHVKDFPDIILCNSKLESLDEIDPEDRNYTREELETKRAAQLGRMIDDRSG